MACNNPLGCPHPDGCKGMVCSSFINVLPPASSKIESPDVVEGCEFFLIDLDTLMDLYSADAGVFRYASQNPDDRTEYPIPEVRPLLDKIRDTCKVVDVDSYLFEVVVDIILEDLSSRSCIGPAIEEVEKERGPGWVKMDVIKTIKERARRL